jgi:putative oxidoreductase
MDWLINDGLPHLARICLVVLFPFSGLDKIVNRESALKQAASSFLPGAPVLLVLAMIVEFVTPVCIVSVRRSSSFRPCWVLRDHGHPLP